MTWIQPLRREDLPEFEDVFKMYEETVGFVPNSLFTMGRMPEMLRAFLQLNRAVYHEGRVPRTLKAMVAMVASASAGCRYCQAHTAQRAASDGVDVEKIESVWEFEHSPLYDDYERAALRLARDAGSVPNAVTGAHFDDLAQFVGPEEVTELVAVISLFGWLNRWNDTMATALEEGPASTGENHLNKAGWSRGKH